MALWRYNSLKQFAVIKNILSVTEWHTTAIILLINMYKRSQSYALLLLQTKYWLFKSNMKLLCCLRCNMYRVNVWIAKINKQTCKNTSDLKFCNYYHKDVFTMFIAITNHNLYPFSVHATFRKSVDIAQEYNNNFGGWGDCRDIGQKEKHKNKPE